MTGRGDVAGGARGADAGVPRGAGADGQSEPKASAGAEADSRARGGRSRYAAAPPFAVLPRARAFVRRIRARLHGEPTARQQAALRAARLVTIDVFDTALLRCVAQPVDVFALAAWRYARRSGSDIDVRRLRDARIAAETECRHRAATCGAAEITLTEIYALLDDVKPAERAGVMAEELATERDVCVGNPDVLRLYARIRAAGTPVAFVSDTYFPTGFVEELLHASGYREAHRVFTSSQWRQTKHGGGLFEIVTRETGVAARSIVHVGDNPRSDVENAFRAGFRPLWYVGSAARPRARSEPSNSEAAIAASLVAGIAALPPVNSWDAAEEPWAAIGSAVAAPVYLGLAQWLRAQLRDFEADRVLFCARDGLIVKNVYERLAPASPGAGRKGDYFSISRRTLVFPSFERLGDFELDFLCSSPFPIAAREFLQRIGFPADRLAAVLEAHGLDRDCIIASDAQRTHLRGMMAALAPEILAACAAERNVLLSYLEELDARSWRRVAVCDVGWHGSLQYALTNVMRSVNAGVEYRGFYLGTSERAADFETASSTTRGWIWNRGEPRSRMETQENGREVIELLFTARHGSVVGRLAGPPTQPVFDDTSTLDAANRRAAGAIQAAALIAVDRYIASFGGVEPAAVSAQTAFESLVGLIERPSQQEVRAIGKLVHVAGFGSTQVGQPLADPPSLAQALRGPRDFLMRYRTCRWPTGYLSAFFGTWKIAYAVRLVRRRLERRGRR